MAVQLLRRSMWRRTLGRLSAQSPLRRTNQKGIIMAAKWHFVESEKDGELWLKSPREQTACVEFESSDGNGQKTVHRVMVVTRGWLEQHLGGVRESATGPLWAGVPSLLVVPDATGDKRSEEHTSE